MPRAFISKIAQNAKKQGGINRGCKSVAEQLDNEWTWKHIYKVFRGMSKPSQRLIASINSLQIPYPTRKRYRLKVEAVSEKQLERLKTIPMKERLDALEERRSALDNAGKDE